MVSQNGAINWPSCDLAMFLYNAFPLSNFGKCTAPKLADFRVTISFATFRGLFIDDLHMGVYWDFH